MRTDNKKQIQILTKKIQYISTSIKNDDTDKLNEEITLTINLLKKQDFLYKSTFFNAKNKQHQATFKTMSNRNRALLIANLQDIQREYDSKNPNTRFCLYLIKTIISDKLFMKSLQAKMDLSDNDHHHQPLKKSEMIVVHPETRQLKIKGEI